MVLERFNEIRWNQGRVFIAHPEKDWKKRDEYMNPGKNSLDAFFVI